jgi:hypothetical protein
MKHLFFALAASALLLAGCSDNPFSPFADADPQFTQDVSGPTWVYGSFATTAGASPAGVNAHPRNAGSCRQADGTIDLANPQNNTTWFNPQGRWTNAKFCQGAAGGAATTCSFRIEATYAQLTNNDNLNFLVINAADYDAVTNSNPDLFVHYRGNQDDTRGRGVLNFSYTCLVGLGGTGSLDLEQFAKNPGSLFLAPPNPIIARPAPALGNFEHELKTNQPPAPQTWIQVVTSVHGSANLLWLAWDYRSRVGE